MKKTVQVERPALFFFISKEVKIRSDAEYFSQTTEIPTFDPQNNIIRRYRIMKQTDWKIIYTSYIPAQSSAPFACCPKRPGKPAYS